MTIILDGANGITTPSDVTIQSSGGGNFVIQPANSATDRTLTLPDEAGTVLTSASGIPASQLTGVPAFSAYANAAVSIPHSTYTKVLYQVERFDTDGIYDNSTSRLQPTVAGYYQVTAGFGVAQAALYYARAFFFFNGGAYIAGGTSSGQTNGYPSGTVTALIYMNGTSDYLEVYALQGSGGTYNSTANSLNDYFQAVLVRAA